MKETVSTFAHFRQLQHFYYFTTFWTFVDSLVSSYIVCNMLSNRSFFYPLQCLLFFIIRMFLSNDIAARGATVNDGARLSRPSVPGRRGHRSHHENAKITQP